MYDPLHKYICARIYTYIRLVYIISERGIPIKGAKRNTARDSAAPPICREVKRERLDLQWQHDSLESVTVFECNGENRRRTVTVARSTNSGPARIYPYAPRRAAPAESIVRRVSVVFAFHCSFSFLCPSAFVGTHTHTSRRDRTREAPNDLNMVHAARRSSPSNIR